MVRPLRIEFPGALYHITARGDRREAIYEEDADFLMYLGVLSEVIERFNWVCHAYCLMNNHYHLVVETPDANLAKGMRHLNGVFTQASNRKYHRAGHLFQGRYKAILVDGDAYFMELSRYVVLNPVRANMVKMPQDWPWSSYRATVGLDSCPDWLSADAILSMFGNSRSWARQKFAEFAVEGVGKESIWSNLRQQIYLGDESFVERMQSNMKVEGQEATIPRVQRRPAPASLEKISERSDSRNEAIIEAYRTGGYSYREIAEYFGVHLSTIGRIVRAGMGQRET